MEPGETDRGGTLDGMDGQLRRNFSSTSLLFFSYKYVLSEWTIQVARQEHVSASPLIVFCWFFERVTILYCKSRVKFASANPWRQAHGQKRRVVECTMQMMVSSCLEFLYAIGDRSTVNQKLSLDPKCGASSPFAIDGFGIILLEFLLCTLVEFLADPLLL
ncbi:hypothetical protein M501DRAFT_18628 [Patellaria atrata CBS 101060]|uniref:Uncharacterized protein n=1 Tax=Patellaria atrata CBS 101060 TaxID=1346257 RepID=A0A9P4SHF9_9PEZI|nr:hypothetical protein M501DRAFT_18628 [Patellaria atrata CBS 101060]